MSASPNRLSRAPLAALALLLLAFQFLAPVGPASAAQRDAPVIGPVRALALDASGNGWGWAAPTGFNGQLSYILRIEGGSYRIYTDPAVLMPPPGVTINGMAISADGSDGWATGYVGGGDNQQALLWRLQNGSWSSFIGKLPTKTLPGALTELHSVSISADGKTGWMVGVTNSANSDFVLFKLDNNIWIPERLPADNTIFDLAISADGKSGWGWGLAPTVPLGNAAFQLQNGAWQPINGEVMPSTHESVAITVANNGAGWIASNHFRQIANGILTRLRPGMDPKQYDIEHPYRNIQTAPFVILSGMAVDPLGRGWAIGRVSVADTDPASDLPLLLRLEDQSATFMDASGFGLSNDQVSHSDLLATNAAGTHTWLAYHDNNNRGYLTELREYWQHDAPAAAAPLQDSGQCFSAVKYCLRGVFSTYWDNHGGLQQLGYPITPEVQETIGGATYTVQYTQRARLEWHPEYKGSSSEVLLGLLGNTIVNTRLNEGPFQPAKQVTSFDVRYFPQTQHNLSVPILPYWDQHGGLPVFGYPRSEAFEEVNQADGKTYLVQYFERNRIEFHPENRGTQFEFQLGLLGAEQFKKTYGYVP